MATFNGGRMVALFLCMLFALNVSFAQDYSWQSNPPQAAAGWYLPLAPAQDADGWQWVVFYIVDPIATVDPITNDLVNNEQLEPRVLDYIDGWEDALIWASKEDFDKARGFQEEQVQTENNLRLEAAKDSLMADMKGGISSWFPSWLPLACASTQATPSDIGDQCDVNNIYSQDLLFGEILDIEGAKFVDQPGRITLEDFIVQRNGEEPFGRKADGRPNFRTCGDKDADGVIDSNASSTCTRFNQFSAKFRQLLNLHLDHQSSDPVVAPGILSFVVPAKFETEPDIPRGDTKDRSFVSQLDEEGTTTTITDPTTPPPPSIQVVYDYDRIRHLQPAKMNPNTSVIDFGGDGTPYWQPAAKPVSSAETSSWGRIKATFAD